MQEMQLITAYRLFENSQLVGFVKSWQLTALGAYSRGPALVRHPFSALTQFNAVRIACHDLASPA